MPRKIKFGGRVLTVPDDATDEEIQQILAPAPPRTQTAPQMHTPFGGPPTRWNPPMEANPNQLTEQSKMAPMLGAIIGGASGGGGGASIGALGGSFLDTLARSFLKSQFPAVYGKEDVPETYPQFVGKTGEDLFLNATLPHLIGAGGTQIANREIASLPGIRNLPAVRQAVARQLSQQAQQQFTRPETEVLTDAAREAERNRATQLFQIGDTGKYIQSTENEALGPLATSPRTGRLEPVPNRYPSVVVGGQPMDITLDPEATSRWQEARFGQQAPYQPINISEILGEVQPIRVEPQTAPVQPVRFVKGQEYQNLTKSKEFQPFIPTSVQATGPVEQVEIPGQFQVRASGAPRKVKSGEFQVTPSGPIKENQITQNEIGQKLLQLQKDIRSGTDVMKTQNWSEIRRLALSDPAQMHNLKLVGGQGAVDGLVFNEILGKNSEEILNPKKLLDQLNDPERSAIWAQVSPDKMESFQNLLSAVRNQQEGHGLSDALLRWSKGRLQVGGLGLAVFRPSIGVPVVGGSLGILGVNKFFEILMREPEYAQIVTKALTTPAASVEAKPVAEALRVVFASVKSQLDTEDKVKQAPQ